jgi:hypothetical protein
VPAGLPVVGTSDSSVVGKPVWIGGFRVTGIAASCAGSVARLARHECGLDEFGVEFRITTEGPDGRSNTATRLHYCGHPDCDAETSGSDGSVQLRPHWAMWHDYALGSSLFFVAAWALCACWLTVVLSYVAIRVRPTR